MLRKSQIILLSLSVIAQIYATGRGYCDSEADRLILKSFSFSDESAFKEWDEKVFKGHVDYKIEGQEGSRWVSAKSNANASALYHKIELDMERYPKLTWRWKVNTFPKKTGDESLKSAEEDDYGARMYVVFPGFLPTGAKAIEYIWSKSIPEGTISASPYSANLQLMVIETGNADEAKWAYEERDIYEDYIAVFGKEPKGKAKAIVFMTDSDSTGTEADALYDEIKIEYQQ
jgi:hypothetical protein